MSRVRVVAALDHLRDSIGHLCLRVLVPVMQSPPGGHNRFHMLNAEAFVLGTLLREAAE
jgi:hypothetical protein